MANVYSTIADGGWRNKQITIRKVVFPTAASTRAGASRTAPRCSRPPRPRSRRRSSSTTSQYGTATGSAIGCPTAAKTGTTSGLVDAWLDGFTPNRTTVVWMGYAKSNISMTDVHGQAQFGGLLPAQIWHNFM